MNENLQRLHSGLVEDGYYTKSFEEFSSQMKDINYRQRLFEGISADGEFIGSFADFEETFHNPRPASKKEEETKKKDQSDPNRVKQNPYFAQKEFDSENITSGYTLSADKKRKREEPEEQTDESGVSDFVSGIDTGFEEKPDTEEYKEKSGAMFDMALRNDPDSAFNTMPEITRDIIKKDDENLAPILTDQWSKYGFKFEATGGAAEKIKVTAFNGDVKIFDVDAWTKRGNVEYAEMMDKWMRIRAINLGDKLDADLALITLSNKERKQAELDGTATTYSFYTNSVKSESEEQRQANEELLREDITVIQPTREDRVANIQVVNPDVALYDEQADIIMDSIISNAAKRKLAEELNIPLKEVNDKIRTSPIVERRYEQLLKETQEEADNFRNLRAGLHNVTTDMNGNEGYSTFEYSEEEGRMVRTIISKEERDARLKMLEEEDPFHGDFVAAMQSTRRSEYLERKMEKHIEDMGGGIFSKSEQQKELHKLAVKKEKELSSQVKKTVSKANIVSADLKSIQSEIDDLSDWFDNNTSILDEIEKIKKGRYTTQEEVDAANAKISNLANTYIDKAHRMQYLQTKGQQYLKLGGKIQKDLENLQMDEEELIAYTDAIGRNYQWGTVLASQLLNATIDLGQNLIEVVDMVAQIPHEIAKSIDDPVLNAWVQIATINPASHLNMAGNVNTIVNGAGETKNIIGHNSVWDDWSKGLNKWQEEGDWWGSKKNIKHQIQYGDINSFGDFAEWGAGVLMTQVPNLALLATTGGTAGLVLLGASGTGGKWRGMNDEKEAYFKTGGLYGQDHSFHSMFLNATFSGSVEALSERVTLGQIRTLKGVLRSFKGGAKLGFKRYLKTNVLDYRNVTHGFKDILEEGGSESLATMGGNFADIMSGVEGVGLWDGVEESFVSGALISKTMKAPQLFKSAINPFLSKDSNQKIGENSIRIKELTKQLNESNISELKKDQVEREIAELTEESNMIMELDVKRVDVMENSEKAELIQIEKDIYNARKRAEEIVMDNSMTKEQRRTELDKLQDLVDKKTTRKEDIIGKYPPQEVNKKYKQTVDYIKAQTKMAEQYGAPKTNIKEVNEQQFQEYIANTSYENSVGQIENYSMELDGLEQGLRNILKDKNSTKAEKQEAKDALKNLKEKSEDASGALNFITGNARSYGAMVPKFDKNGNIKEFDIIINKDKSIKDGYLNVGAHEFLHAAFYNTLKADQTARDVLGGNIIDILQSKNVTFKEGKVDLFNKRIARYDDFSRGEEMMTIASEMMIDGDISFNDGALTKLAGVFRRFSQNYLGREIKFDTQKDIKNFLRDYAVSVKNNKPNRAIAKMMAKGANGKMFNEGKTNEQVRDEVNFSKAVEANMRSNGDLLTDIDSVLIHENGGRKHKDHADFKNSPDYYEGYFKIVESPLLDGLIQAGMTEKGVKGQALRDFTRKVKEKIGERYLKNYNLDENDSLFGWLTGVSGGAGKSIIYRAKGDQMAEYKKTIPKGPSLDAPVGDAGTLADIVTASKDAMMTKIENQDMSPGRKQAAVDLAGEMFFNTIELNTDVKSVVDKQISKVQKSKNRIDLKGLTYKGVRNLLTSSTKITRKDKSGKIIIDKKTNKPKLFNPTKTADVKPTGPLYNILAAWSKEVGIDPKRILANQDLDATQRKSIQEWIYSKSVNNDGSFNTSLFDGALPEGETRSGEATGIANTKLGDLYKKGARVKVSEGASKKLGQKESQTKRDDVQLEEWLGVFGINPDGSFQSGTANDGALRQLVVSMAQITANQGLREHATIEGTLSEAVISKLGDGKSQTMWSLNTVEGATTQDIVDNGWGNLINQVAASDLSAQAILSAVNNTYGDTLTNRQKAKVAKNITQEVGDYMAIDKAMKGEFTDVTGKTISDVLIQNFEKRQLEQGVTKSLGLKENVGNRLKTEAGLTKQRQHLKDSTQNMVETLGPVKTATLMIAHAKSAYSDAGKMGDGLHINDGAGGPVIKNLNPERSTENRYQSTSNIADFVGLMNNADIDIKFKKGSKDGKWIKETKPNSGKYQVYDGKKWVSLNTTLLAETSSAAIKDLEGGKYLQRESQADDARLVSKIILDNAWNKVKDPKSSFDRADFGALLMSLGSNMKAPLRRAAPAESIQEGIKDIIAKGKAEGKAIKDIVRYEHTPPKEVINARIIKSYDETDSLQDSVWDGYTVQIISKTADDLINDSGYKSSIPTDGGSRVFNPETLGYILKNPFKEDGSLKLDDISPIKNYNPNKKGEIIGETWIDTVDALGQINNINGVSLFNIVPLARKIGKINRGDAMWSKAPKGGTVWDFDDTLARTKSGVRAKIPNPDGTPKPRRKVIFMAGGAGSGKSSVVKKMNLEKSGYKIVNSDISLEWLKKNHGLPADMKDLTKEQLSLLGRLQGQSRRIAKSKKMQYQGNGDGVVIDGTGASANVMNKQVQEFKDKGYDVGMIFVETSEDVSVARNANRKERSLREDIVRNNHKKVMANKDTYKKLFGENFAEVNTDNIGLDDALPKEFTSVVDNFTNSYENRRLDAEEFANEGAEILEQGGEFDFSEFNEVIGGTKGPLFGEAMNKAKKFGTKDTYVLTARPMEAAPAIQSFLKSQGLDIPLKNITGLANSTPQAKAMWIAENMIAEGYNDIYFADDALQNVDAVQDIIDQHDIKGKTKQAKIQFSKEVDSTVDGIMDQAQKDLDADFNIILEETKGVEAKKEFSAAKARVRGRDKKTFKFFLPPSAEDFKGLVYSFLGKGKVGERQHKFFKEKLFDPFAKGIRTLNTVKQSVANDIRMLKRVSKPIKNKLKKRIPKTEYTYEQAIRVWAYNEAGFTVPGLSKTDQTKLINQVNNDPALKQFAKAYSTIGDKAGGIVEPGNDWLANTISGEINDATEASRMDYLAEWKANKDIIFSEKNLNKIEAVYGSNFREALEDVLYRMETGSNRNYGNSRIALWIGLMDLLVPLCLLTLGPLCYRRCLRLTS
jgi:predicted ABC-type ATPase